MVESANISYIQNDLSEYVHHIFKGPEQYQGFISVVSMSERTDEKPKVVFSCRPAEFDAKVGTFIPSDRCSYFLTKSQTKHPGTWRKSDLFCMNEIRIDIDCHRAPAWRDSSKYERRILDAIYGVCVTERTLPCPNMAVHTGRGIHLIWFIEQVPKSCVKMYRFIASQYVHQVKEILAGSPEFYDYTVDEASSRNPIGLARIPGSINHAVGKRSSYEFFHSVRLDFFKEFDNQLGFAASRGYRTLEERGCGQKGRQKKKCVHRSFTLEEAGRRRIQALNKLKELRSTIECGMRDKFLLIYYNACCMAGMSIEDSLLDTLQVNASFEHPLSPTKLRSYLSSSMRKGYKFKNSTISNWLDISESEAKAIGLGHCVERSSNAARDGRVAARRRDRNKRVIALFKEGFTKTEIGRRVGIAFNTVKKILAEYLSSVAAQKTAADSACPKTADRNLTKEQLRISLSDLPAKVFKSHIPFSDFMPTYRNPPLCVEPSLRPKFLIPKPSKLEEQV